MNYITLLIMLLITLPVQASMTDFETAYKKGDYNKALTLVTKAAKQGEARAQFALGFSYFDGKLGLEKNYPEAIKWLKKSAQQGYKDAPYFLGWAEYSHGINYHEAVKWFE